MFSYLKFEMCFRCSSQRKSRQRRAVGGRTAPFHAYPWIVRTVSFIFHLTLSASPLNSLLLQKYKKVSRPNAFQIPSDPSNIELFDDEDDRLEYKVLWAFEPIGVALSATSAIHLRLRWRGRCPKDGQRGNKIIWGCERGKVSTLLSHAKHILPASCCQKCQSDYVTTALEEQTE